MSQNNPSPLTSKGYPFSKELSSYDAYSLGRAFFADEMVDSYGGMHFFDQIAIFEKLNVQVDAEPYYYKQNAIQVYIYTTDSANELENKFNRLTLKENEVAVFGLVKPNAIAFTLKVSSSLQHLVNKTQVGNASYSVEVSKQDLTNRKITAKWFIDLFATKQQAFFDELNVSTKKQLEEEIEVTLSKTDGTLPLPKTKPVRPETINLYIGVFFDGTGNNKYCSELIYYQCLKDAPEGTKELQNLKVRKILDEKRRQDLENGIVVEPLIINNYTKGAVKISKEMAKTRFQLPKPLQQYSIASRFI